MGYGSRIDVLCSLLTKAKVFADVGCDHGYCSEYMLENGLCERAILSDISAGSLDKAKRLLSGYIASGRAEAVLGDGFFGVPESVDEVLIAGMGGSEIVGILSDETFGFLPRTFVFQPMHDAEKLRRYLVSAGFHLPLRTEILRCDPRAKVARGRAAAKLYRFGIRIRQGKSFQAPERFSRTDRKTAEKRRKISLGREIAGREPQGAGSAFKTAERGVER